MDIFAGLDGLGAAPAKKLSLEEQRRLQANKNKQTVDAFESLDLLGNNTTLKPSLPPKTQPLQVNTNTSTEDDDLFGIFNTAPPPKPQAPSSSTASAATSSQRQQQRQQQQPQPQYSEDLPSRPQRPSQRSNYDDSFSRPQPSRHSQRAEPSRESSWESSRSSDSKVSDRAVAQLAEMGFEPEDASRALKAMDGSVRGAVNWLMAEAQGLPLPTPKRSGLSSSIGAGDFSDFQATASQFGASMFSKASSLFSKGKKELEKAYNQYNNQYNGDPSQPAWLKDKAKYDARRSASPEDELPMRPPRRQQRPVEDAAPSRPSRPSGEPSERLSRAELFRQRQRERGGGSTAASSSVPSRTGSPATGSPALGSPAMGAPAVGSPALGSPAATSSREESPATGPASSAAGSATPDIDLLNLSGASSTAASSSLTSTQKDLYHASRELGTESFKKGDYEQAVNHYTSALEVLPKSSALRALLLSNRSAAYLKAGNLRGAFDDTTEGIALLPLPNNSIEIDEDKKTSSADIWVKLVTRNAQAAESMEKFQAAVKSWQLLLDNGHASPTVLEAKRRCLKALNPEIIAKQERSNAQQQPKKSQRRGWGTTGAVPTSAEGKAALEKVKASHDKLAEEERQKDMLREKVSSRIENWRQGKETNLRELLATLQNVLWDSCDWQPVNSSELVIPKKVRIVYMKAVSRTHPDKVPSTASVEIRMISESVFVTIQSAWEVFRQENNL